MNYGVDPIIKQKVCERDLSREWICMKTPIIKKLQNSKIKHLKVRKPNNKRLEFENVL